VNTKGVVIIDPGVDASDGKNSPLVFEITQIRFYLD
jgi:hypothetical protein